jgi:hypothetical protein
MWRSAYEEILLQDSAGLMGATFPGPCRCLSKKRVGVRSTEHSCHQGLPQPHGDGCERRFLLTPVFASIFATFKFSTFATESRMKLSLV